MTSDPSAAPMDPPEAPSCEKHGTMVPDDEMGRSWHCAACPAKFPAAPLDLEAIRLRAHMRYDWSSEAAQDVRALLTAYKAAEAACVRLQAERDHKNCACDISTKHEWFEAFCQERDTVARLRRGLEQLVAADEALLAKEPDHCPCRYCAAICQRLEAYAKAAVLARDPEEVR